MARVLIQWRNVGAFADKILVFRETSPISSLAGLTPFRELLPDRDHLLDEVGLGTWHYAIQPVLDGQLAGPFSTVTKTITEHEPPELMYQSHSVFWGSSWAGRMPHLAKGYLPMCDPGDLLMVVGNTRTPVGTPVASELATDWNQIAEPAKANDQRPYMFWKYAEEEDAGREIVFDNVDGTTSGWTILCFRHSRQIKVARIGATGHSTGNHNSKPFAFTNSTGKAGLAVCLRENNYATTEGGNYATAPPAPVWSVWTGNRNRSWSQGGTAGTSRPEGDMRHAVFFRPVGVGEAFSFPFLFSATNTAANLGDMCALLYVE